jgi:peptidyl-prolyl cis-trans isomerase SurA
MKSILSIFLLLMAGAPLKAQDEAVVMTIGAHEISRSEFEYAYRKNNAQQQTSLADFTRSFIYMKMESLEAGRLGLDTLPDFTQKMEALAASLRAEQTAGTMTPVEHPYCHLAHLCYYLPQQASSRQVHEATEKMNEIYRAVQSGKSFESLIYQVDAEDHQNLFGEVVTLPKHRTMSVLEQQLSRLHVGELSEPIVSPVGVHLVQLLARHGAYGETATAGAEETSDEYRGYLLAELRDALLGESLRRQLDEEPVEEEQLEHYFKAHKGDYDWNLPHYHGAVFYCANAQTGKQIKKWLKGVPQEAWSDRVESERKRYPNLSFEAEYGLFQIGSNAAIDKQVFKQGNFQPSQENPYVMTLGEVLKKGPKRYTDIREQVVYDYKQSREKEMIAALLKKYKVEINQEVLKTVNNHG